MRNLLPAILLACRLPAAEVLVFSPDSVWVTVSDNHQICEGIIQVLSAKEDAILLTNPNGNRANCVRIVTFTGGKRWIYAAHEKSLLRRETRL